MREDQIRALSFEQDVSTGIAARMVDESPHLFGPNVLSRPLVQDVLFPTLAYAAGPAELGYFAQIDPLYRVFDVSMPLIYPRASFTLVEPTVRRSLEGLDLAAADCVISGDIMKTWQEKISPASGPEDLLIQEKSRAVEKLLEEMTGRALEIDPGAEKQMMKIKESMAYQLSKLKKRIEAARTAMDEKNQHHIEKVRNSLRPGGKPQERVLNFFQFYAERGDDFLSLLMDHIVFRDFRHIILPV